MKIFLTFSFLFFIVFSYAQDSLEKRPSGFTLQLNQDNTFGFFPAVFASFPLGKNDLTFYAIFWTTPVFANADGTGSFVEAGMGVNFIAGNLTMNPSIGFGHGIFTNGRNVAGQGRPTVGECIVPGLISFFRNDKFESELFVAIYKNLRKEISPVTNYILFWTLPGIRIHHVFSAGLHYEQFRDITNGVGTYARYGLYAKLSFKEKYDLRLSAGLNYSQVLNNPKEQGDFYKLTVTIPF